MAAVAACDRRTWITGIGHIAAEAPEDLPRAENVSVDVDADLPRPGDSRHGVLRQLIAMCPPHRIHIQAEVLGDLLDGCPAVKLASDGLSRNAARAGMPKRTSGLTRTGDAESS